MTDIHAVPFDSGGHRAHRGCPCGPVAMSDLNAGGTKRVVFVHRRPPVSDERVITYGPVRDRQPHEPVVVVRHESGATPAARLRATTAAGITTLEETR